MDAVKTGALIAQARKEQDLTQSDLAAQLHVSVQAVSKWERGLNFPDITLLEPLAEQLGLTVTELMAGERNAPPREEVVRDSLRFSLAQLGPRVKKWRIAFVCLALLLLVFGSWRGFVWVRDNTEWLPQKETVVTPVSIRDVDQLLVQLSDMRSAAIFDVALSDEMTGFRLELELWEGGTLTKSWLLLAGSGRIEGIEGMRHQKIGLSLRLMDDQVSCDALMGGSFTNGTLTDFPIERWSGYSRAFLTQRTTLSREDGAVLAHFKLDTGNGILAGDALGTPGIPRDKPGFTHLLVRLTCEYDP